MPTYSNASKFPYSSLLWDDTPVETEFPVYTAAISATTGILVYEDRNGDIRQVVSAEFGAMPLIYIEAAKVLESGKITAGLGTGDTVTTTAQNVRVFW